MIVVVEGPSASGKTTWSEAHGADHLVPEIRPTDPPGDEATAARLWAAFGADRWRQALELELTHGIAVCDSDPLKLHYAWSLWRIGAGTEADFRHQAAAYRETMVSARIGFADCYVVEVPAPSELASRRAADTTRKRRNFALHSRLGAPLREWYALIDRLRPGSVRWEFPPDGLASLAAGTRSRYDTDAFDALVRAANLAASAAFAANP